ncbi:SpaH/EbpB family LPXTG-anchored major pilin [Aerococcus urinaeequi]|uniref:SpaH/EbpB family LPXTG-anchored major pilin n=1 Tax=Aerococcus urinaeequi TaxID=51665 RepID=UPI003D6B5A39
MKKTFKLILSVLSALLIFASVFAGNTMAAVTRVVPEFTTVHIHKLQADEYNADAPLTNENGEAIYDFTNVGQNVRPLKGVTFTAYPVSADTTQEDVNSGNYTPTGAGIELGTTTADGVVTWTVPKAENGTYVVEETGRPDNVSNSLAVPFLISFPMGHTDGSGYLNEVHVYPKNTTGEFPTPGKDVASLGNNEVTFEVGQPLSWFLKGTIPTNIQEYTKYDFNDQLDGALYYRGVDYVRVGGTNLTEDTHYVVNFNETTNTVQVRLTAEGIIEIARLVPLANRNSPAADAIADISENTNENPFIEVKLDTVINDNAVLGKPIENNTTITFNNTGDTSGEHETNPSDIPEVTTGGKTFVKTNTGGEGLEGAVFGVYNNDETPVAATDALLALNPSATDVNGQLTLTSSSDGSFDIRGLAFGQYYLVENRAPEGYVVLQENIDFEVNQTSYNTTPTTIDMNVGDAEPMNIVNNNRPSIPETGGMGTIIFILLGLGLVGLAIFGFRKNSVE